MGMYDHIVCKAKLPGTPPAFVTDHGHQFQTKDTPEQYLTTYEITEDGRLLDSGGVDQEFHGDLEFYDSNIVGCGPDGSGGSVVWTRNGEDAESVDYRARFNAGKLMGIVVIEQTKKPAKSEAARPRPPRPTPEEVRARKDRIAEALLGRTVFVLWGGQPIEKGYAAEVIAEDDGQLVFKSAENGFEVIHRSSRDRTFFDSAEAAIASREADRKQQRIEAGLEPPTESAGGAA